MPSEYNDILKLVTQKDLQAYYDETYGKPGHTDAQNNELKVKALKETEQGDIFFQDKNYTQAAQHYLQSLRSPLYLFEGFYKLGLCVLHGADVKKAKLNELNLYKKRGGDHLNSNELAAVFFREVMVLEPEFNVTSYPFSKKPLNLYFSCAIYQLGLCLSRGAPVHSQDLINTCYQGSEVTDINSKNVQKAFYQRVLLINSDHQEAQKKFTELLQEKLPMSWYLKFPEKDLSASFTEFVISKQQRPPLLLSLNSPSNKQGFLFNNADAFVSPLATPGAQEETRCLERPPQLCNVPTELNLYELDQQGLLSPVSPSKAYCP